MPSPRWDIRAARPADAPDVAVCHIESWRGAYRGLVPEHVLDSFEVSRAGSYWARVIDAQQTTLFLAVDPAAGSGSRVLGFAHTGPARDVPRIADRELYALYVRSDWHGTGMAADLMREILLPDVDTALWVFEENPRAKNFYRKFGFAADGARRREPISMASEIRMIARPALTWRRSYNPVRPWR
ncbi:MAG: GNAT family N-acetyltransferase [Nocardia sp.]|nr:GNAT family N-acetyltransferase [Nocardia sp.]